MKYKIISMDFDGTLLTSDKMVSSSNKEILFKLKDMGYLIIGVTGRNLSSAMDICDINMFNYLIVNNGAYIYDVENKNGYNTFYLEDNIIKDIFNSYKDKSETIIFSSNNNYYIYRENAEVYKSFLVPINEISQINEKICKMNLYMDNNILLQTKEYILKKYKDDLNVFLMMDSDDLSNNKWIVISPIKLNKYNALIELANKLNIKNDEIIFFGDAANDIEAIKGVGLGVAMGNAIDEVKEVAKEITLSNNDDGIANFLKNLIFF